MGDLINLYYHTLTVASLDLLLPEAYEARTYYSKTNVHVHLVLICVCCLEIQLLCYQIDKNKG